MLFDLFFVRVFLITEKSQQPIPLFNPTSIENNNNNNFNANNTINSPTDLVSTPITITQIDNMRSSLSLPTVEEQHAIKEQIDVLNVIEQLSEQAVVGE